MGRGTWERWDKSPTVDEYHALDVRYVARLMPLAPGHAITLGWHRGDRQVAAIQIVTDEGWIRLLYTASGEPIDERVAVDETPCNFGGTRPWWLCAGCGHRVAVLYGGPRFRCRRCWGLTYESTREDQWARIDRRARKLAERMGGTAWTGPGPRPKGVHWDRWEAGDERWIELRHRALAESDRFLERSGFPVPPSSRLGEWDAPVRRGRPAVPCGARRTNGEPCGNYAMHGCQVCHAHGGRAPQVRRAAARRAKLADLISTIAEMDWADRGRWDKGD